MNLVHRSKGLIAELPNMLSATSEVSHYPAGQALLDSDGGGWRPLSSDREPSIQV